MRIKQLIRVCVFLATASVATAQTTPQQLADILSVPLQTPTEIAFELRDYLMDRVAKFTVPADASQWTSEENQLRKHLLSVVFHGWPPEWVNSPPKFEDEGFVPGGVGYRMRK